MTGLALRSLAARRTAFAACALSVFLGATLVLAFGTLLGTALGEGVSAADRETLATLATVVGSWSVVIVLFSVASTLGVSVRRRAEEFALLRMIGSTRRQVRSLVLRETLVVGVLASALAIVPGWLLGRAVLTLLERADMVASGVEHRTGVVPIVTTVAVMVAAAGAAALLAARHATAGSAQLSLRTSRTGRERTGRRRVALGILLLAVGATYSTLTVTVTADSADPYAAMSTAGPASVFWSLGFAVLAPSLLRLTAGVWGGPLRRGPVAGFLAVSNARHRSHQLGTVLAPVVILVGMATGTLSLVSIENATVAGAGDAAGQDIELINDVVVGMISVFAAIMAVNALVAAVSDRRRELGQQRLAGAGPSQLTAMVAGEALLVLVAAAVFGGLASLGTSIPYSVVKTDGWFPDGGVALYAGVCAVAAALTVGTAVVAARRALRGPAVAAARAG